MSKDFVVIIRSAGERTEEACRYLITKQVSQDKIFVVKDKPFSATLFKAFETGIDSKRFWTICIDADILITQNAIPQYLKSTGKFKDNTFGFNGFVLDKFYGQGKGRGFIIYRTDFLKEALKKITKFKLAIRPESAVREEMVAEGYEWLNSDEIYGVHDYEQYYADIFRKMATRAQKSKNDIDLLLKRCMQNQADYDFRLALQGLLFGKELSVGDVLIHADQWADVSNKWLHSYNLKEKQAMSPSELKRHFVLSMIWKKKIASFFRKPGLQFKGSS